MIYNFVLTHYGFENSIRNEVLSVHLHQLLTNVLYENIVLISDKNNHVWRKIKEGLQDLYKSSDSNLKKIETKMVEVRKSNKIFNNTTVYDEDNVDQFVKSIEDDNIEIDGIIVNDDKKKLFKNTISMQNYGMEDIEEHRKKFFANGLVDIDRKDRNFLLLQLKKISWNSGRIYYYDFNLSKTDNSYHRRGWVHGFKLLADSFVMRHQKIKGKPLIEIYTPVYKLEMNYSDTTEDKKRAAIKENIKRYEEIDNDIFKPIRDIVDVNFYFYDPKDHTNPPKGKKGHNRYLQTVSTVIDIEDGFDIFDQTGKIIKFADWTFALKSRESLEKIRNLPKYNSRTMNIMLDNC